ncbi:MAG: alpha/beta hydrolase [Lentisphaeria bacterium]
MSSAEFPPYAMPIGAVDPEEEWLFPEGLPDYDPAADNDPRISNPEAAEKGGYLDRHLANVRIPSLFAYPADSATHTGAAVLICPGGGYQILAFDKEGTDLARFLNSLGVTAFVLKYHLTGDETHRGSNPFAPLRDAQRALRLIRSRARQYGLRPDKIGIMGFSAGAHLAACAATLFLDRDESRHELAAISARPDFCALIYPVVTFCMPQMHAGSCHNLLGSQASEELKRQFSPEAQVCAETPPTLLIQAVDDAVLVENSLLYFAALKAAGVATEMHIYPEGGHGYGMRQRGMTIDSWPERLRDWLLRQV